MIFNIIVKVIHPTDSLGRICGSGNLTSRKYLLYFDLTRCLNPAVLAYGCNTPQVRIVSSWFIECHTTSKNNVNFLFIILLTYALLLHYIYVSFQVCVETCPQEYMRISENKEEFLEKFCYTSDDVPLLPFKNDVDTLEGLSLNDLVQKSICPAWVLPSDPFLGRCLPSPPNVNSRSDAGPGK